jgi:nicotinamidase/pyrazinamidase
LRRLNRSVASDEQDLHLMREQRPNGQEMQGGRRHCMAGPGDALVVVDVQRDFLPGGSLAVADGDRVLRPINACLELFATHGLAIFASRDWHPPNHCSFRAQGGPWPPHCVAGSAGAAFADELHLPAHVGIVSKATRAEADSYSAFGGTDLMQRLRSAGVKRLFVGGLATDYCVLHTVSDALGAGFAVVVLRDAIAAVDARPGDGDRAIERMRELGASFVDSAEIVGPAARFEQPARH